jgi:HEAT repeat protein
MDVSWRYVLEAVESGDPDRVNDATDRIGDLNPEARLELFESGADELVAIYEGSDDGYVRQSVVRAVDEFSPGMVLGVRVADDEAAIADVRAHLDTACGFLLVAIQDEDGRVRQAAKRALKDVYRGYRSIEDTETVEGVAEELGALAEGYEGSRREHLLDSKADAERFLCPVGKGLVGAVRGLEESDWK